jgi:thiopeptide-type bacteriocin biosynthesis protein
MTMNKIIKRKFYPGDLWLYVKIYASSIQCESLLITRIPKIVTALIRKSIIQKWFFIRYMDPDTHLRVRFYLKDTKDFPIIMGLILKELRKELSCGIVQKIQYDTYIREIERYYESNIDDTESLFYADSTTTLLLLKAIHQNKTEDEERVAIACKSIDQLLTDFGYDIDSKLSIITMMSNSFCREFGYNDRNQMQLNTIFRDISKRIEPYVFSNGIVFTPFQQTICDIIFGRSMKQTDVISAIKKNIKYSKQKEQELICSYIHMMMNRLFCSQNRKYELLVYYFMKKKYTSIIARQEKGVILSKCNELEYHYTTSKTTK